MTRIVLNETTRVHTGFAKLNENWSSSGLTQFSFGSKDFTSMMYSLNFAGNFD